MTKPIPKSIDETQALLAGGDYVADRSLATALFLALAMQRPLFLEGEAGVGKTEIAKVLAQALGRDLIRLQCYEGLDIAQAAYEWNYAAPDDRDPDGRGGGASSRARASSRTSSRSASWCGARCCRRCEPAGAAAGAADRRARPHRRALRGLSSSRCLSDLQVTIPEIGTVRAAEPPIVVITSNRTREIHDAVKRRCLYHWVDYPDAERELADPAPQGPGARPSGSRARSSPSCSGCARRDLFKLPGRRRDHRLGARPRRARPRSRSTRRP